MSDYSYLSSDDDEDNNDDFDDEWEDDDRLEMRKADRLSRRLLAVDDDDHVQVDRILRKSLKLHHPIEGEQQQQQQPQLGFYPTDDPMRGGAGAGGLVDTSSPYPSPQFRPIGKMSIRNSGRFRNMLEDALIESQEKARRKIFVMLTVAVCCLGLVIALAYFEVKGAQPPKQPVGPYLLLERQEGDDFFKAYEFYEGPDSAGSNGYNNYVSKATAETLGIINVTYEDDELDVYGRRSRRRLNGEPIQDGEDDNDKRKSPISEPFVYMRTAPTPDGPRQSIRLEGIRFFNRGLFIIDIRHMPAGCGVWPAFWLTDEANWPVNGEIDIVEGVNFQTEAKTALHSTQGCSMNDIPLGTMTGGWDTAIGIPNADTGIPDMTMRYAKNCFVYDQHQWLNQGCVAVDLEGGSLGQPLNDKGGGVFALGKSNVASLFAKPNNVF